MSSAASRNQSNTAFILILQPWIRPSGDDPKDVEYSGDLELRSNVEHDPSYTTDSRGRHFGTLGNQLYLASIERMALSKELGLDDRDLQSTVEADA